MSYKIKSVGSDFVGHYQVDGGTGKFAKATGTGELVVSPTAPGIVIVTMDGVISF